MKLLIDAGNTRIKWQLRDHGAIRLAGADAIESEDLFRSVSADLWRQIGSVAVSTVRSEDSRLGLEQVVARYTECPVRFFWAQAAFGQLTSGYLDPSTMGADRWHAMVGAWNRVQGACVVVDAGSAITVDWIDKRGRHLGGHILPGRRMMTASLRQSTARVQFEGGEADGVSPGRTTAECVFHGVNWLIQALALQLGKAADVPVLLTGGDGHLIDAALANGHDEERLQVRLLPGLVFDGLALVEAN